MAQLQNGLPHKHAGLGLIPNIYRKSWAWAMPLAVSELGSKSQEIPKSVLGLAERPYLKENRWSPRNELCPPHAEHACIQTEAVTQENNFVEKMFKWGKVLLT